jgi:hypothetical protein
MYRRARPHRSRWTRSTPCSGKKQTTRNPSEPSSATRPFGRRGRGAFVVLGCQYTLSPAVVVLIFGPCSLLSSRLRGSTHARTSCEDTGDARLRSVARVPRWPGQGLHLSGRCGRARSRRGARALRRGCCWQGPGSSRAAASVQTLSVCCCSPLSSLGRRHPFVVVCVSRMCQK